MKGQPMGNKNRKKVLVIDVETTGLDPAKHACIEIGAILLDEALNPVDEFSSLIAPMAGTEVNEESMAVNRIRMEDLRSAPDYQTVIGEFNHRFCSNQSIPTIAGWNVWFDMAFMRILFERVGMKWPFGHRFLDLQSVAQFFSGFRGVSLEETVQSLLGEKQTHRAIDDTRHTVKVFQHLAKQHLS
jgi:DNA polymerase III epsilon subunit-like protein